MSDRWSLEITVDAVDAERAALFWAAALGYRVLYRRPPYVVLGPEPDGAGPRVLVQHVPELPPADAGQRVHLDLRVPEPDREVERLVGLGAAVQREVDERDRGGSRWWVLADPGGTLFCVCPRR